MDADNTHIADALDALAGRITALEKSARSNWQLDPEDVIARLHKTMSVELKSNLEAVEAKIMVAVAKSIQRMTESNRIDPNVLVEAIGEPIVEQLNQLSEETDRKLRTVKSTVATAADESRRAAQLHIKLAAEVLTGFATTFAFGEEA